MSFSQPSNGLYATVIGNNQIQFSLDTTGAVFIQDHLLVTVEYVNNPAKQVIIDLNINTGSLDTIVKNN